MATMLPLLTPPATVSITVSAPGSNQSPESMLQATATATRSMHEPHCFSVSLPPEERTMRVEVPVALDTWSSPSETSLRRASPVKSAREVPSVP